MKLGQYLELIGPAGSGKSTFHTRISHKNSDIVNVKRAAWEMLTKTDVLPVHLRYLPKLLSAKLAGRNGQRTYAKIWLEKNCSVEDRELLRTASAALKEVDTSDLQMEWLINRQPVILAMGRPAQKFKMEQQKLSLGMKAFFKILHLCFLREKQKGISSLRCADLWN